MTLIWFITFLILLIIEIVTVNLVSIWFALGAIGAMIAAVITDSAIIQITVFLIVSFITLLLTKPVMRKFKKFDIEPTNFDRVIGKIAEVTKKIGKNEYGEVKVFGNTWTATSDDTIEVGSKVKVLSIDGVKLIVKKEEE